MHLCMRLFVKLHQHNLIISLNMKTLYAIVMSALVVIAGCGDSKEKKENISLKAEVAKLKKENASLKSGELKLTATINDYNKFLKEIEKNLASIDENKTMLVKLNKEKKTESTVKEDIKSRINTIKELMENSKLRIVALDKSLAKLRRESGDKSAEILELDKQVKELTKDLIAKDKEIEELDGELANAETLYAFELENSNELRSIINRAYYIIGTNKELKAKGVVMKDGGFIGLGKVKVINANASDTLFHKVKKDETTEIMLNAKKATMITKHPDGSYKIEGEESQPHKLIITDKDAFWKESNYLVIEIDK